MKKVLGITKKTKSYAVQFDEEIIMIEPEIFLKYHIKTHQEFDKKTFASLCLDNDYAFYNKLGIAKLKKMLTVHEMREYLNSKGAKEAIIKQLISRYTEKKYLDDFAYAKLYTQLKQNSEGPAVIINRLREKGISKDIIDGFVKRIDENEILNYLLPKKMSSIKNKSRKQMIQTLKGFFLRKGFSLDAVESVIKKSLSSYDVNEIDLIKKNYAKLYQKYRGKMEEKELKYFLTQKLYAKGFKIEDIRKVIT